MRKKKYYVTVVAKVHDTIDVDAEDAWEASRLAKKEMQRRLRFIPDEIETNPEEITPYKPVFVSPEDKAVNKIVKDELSAL